MYIELFLLDNFVFDMLILRLASAVCRMPYSRIAAAGVCIICSVYSAYAVQIPLLRSLPSKIVLCAVMTVPFFIKAGGIRIMPILSVLLSTVCAGGLAYAASEGIMRFAPSYIRLVIYPAFILSAVPSVLRHIQNRAAKKGVSAHVYAVCADNTYEFDGIFDSGSDLAEPVSGLPVIMVYAPELTCLGEIPVSYRDTGSEKSEVKAFMPDRLYVNGEPVTAFLAPTCVNPAMPALVPWVCREYIDNRGDVYEENTFESV